MDDDILTSLELNEEQRAAAFQQGLDTAVVAGAGCGKTATLVGRYLYLLQQGFAPGDIVAITFTERAGQEMRTRIRDRIREHLARRPADGLAWLEHYLALDAAPIGTIHSFCARLLRAHPAEAALDPAFAVADENQAAAVAAEAVERALVWATGDPQVARCFGVVGGPDALRRLLTDMVARRAEVEEGFARAGPDVLARWRQYRFRWLHDVLHGPAWEDCLAALEAMWPLVPGDALDGYRLSAVAAARRARELLAAGDWPGALGALADGLRRPGGAGSRQNWGEQLGGVRATIRALCDLYGDEVGKVADHADPALDAELAAVWPGLEALFRQAVREYEALKAQRQVVDFDDLETGALRLLESRPDVAHYHQARVKAVLVDEFQDTNDRQRQLVEAVLGARAGQGGRLFIVGDAKQSIYRFRGADVTVFRQVEQEIARRGGRLHALARTYRAHAGLLEVMNELLAGILGGDDDPARPYRVPFAALRPADDRAPRLRPPFVELHLGVGGSAGEGRKVAAAALAARLLRLHHEEGARWGQMACLFRATTYFPVYEQAFEEARIPYVTVAGAGFFDRPEVRDLLNGLRAVATPTDDLAMAGLLRSPAIGLTDASIYLLRWGTEPQARPLWQALRGDLSALEPAEQERARRAAGIVAEVAGQVGRQPVAAVLKRFLDLTGYRAILRLCPGMERAGRNVDKLLADAHRSGTVGVGDFMHYVQTLSDTAAREGEAPPEAGEAVQLMSVHRAKGLEFDLVAIADAGHQDRVRTPDMLLHPDLGLLLRVSRAEGGERWEGVAYRLARRREEEMDDAEERRLLYVAATRARDKLLVSGHARRTTKGFSLQGWARRLAEALGGDGIWPGEPPETGQEATLPLWQGRISCSLYGPPPTDGDRAAAVEAIHAPQAPDLAPAAPLVPPYRLSTGERPGAASPTPDRVWRVIPTRPRQTGPRWLVGKLVHLGLRLWRFDGDTLLLNAFRAAAQTAGLTDAAQIQATGRDALRLLARFHESPFFQALDRAPERRHEVPFARRSEAGPWGRIDLLCRLPDGGWWLVDFKTHRLASAQGLELAERQYAPQLHRYAQAVRTLLGQEPRLFLCFLDYAGQVTVRELQQQRQS